jgi:hypothetical protein
MFLKCMKNNVLIKTDIIEKILKIILTVFVICDKINYEKILIGYVTIWNNY